MKLHDTFTRRIIIAKDIDQVFNAWVVEGQMEKWFLKSAKFIRNGAFLKSGETSSTDDSYEWIWHTWPENVQIGSVLEVKKNEKFSFTFSPAGNVHVDFIKRSETSTEVILTQSEIPAEGENWYNYFYGCTMGWSFWLVNLKAFLEHQIVLDQREILYSDDRHIQMVNQ